MSPSPEARVDRRRDGATQVTASAPLSGVPAWTSRPRRLPSRRRSRTSRTITRRRRGACVTSSDRSSARLTHGADAIRRSVEGEILDRRERLRRRRLDPRTRRARRRRFATDNGVQRPGAVPDERRVRPAVRGRARPETCRRASPTSISRRPVSTRTSWVVEAATAQGAVSSWFVGGSYATVVADSHALDVHSSYSRQRYAAATRRRMAAFVDGSRNVGGVQVSIAGRCRRARSSPTAGTLRALRLPERPRALQPADVGRRLARRSHLGARQRDPADDRARRRGVRAAGLRQPRAAAAAHLRAARARRGVRSAADATPRAGARAGCRRRSSSTFSHFRQDVRRSAGHGLRRRANGRRAATRSRALLGRQCRRASRRRAGA